MEYKETYDLDVKCRNCGHKTTIQIPKGQRFSISIECENCECMDLFTVT